MYTLVIFEDGVHHICGKNKLKKLQGDRCTVRYKTYGCFPARILAQNADIKVLESLKCKAESVFYFGEEHIESIKVPGIKEVATNLENYEAHIQEKSDESPYCTACSSRISEAESNDGNMPRSYEKSRKNSPIKLSFLANFPAKYSHDEQDTLANGNESQDITFPDSQISGNDSDYQPSIHDPSDSSSTSNGKLNDTRNVRHSNRNSKNNSSLEMSFSTNVPGKSSRDDNEMFVALAGKSHQRRSFCMYCRKMQSKFVRHLENKHKDVPDVQKFALLPKGNPERLMMIDKIRKNCMFFYNTNNLVNDGELMVCRRPNTNAPRTASHYKVCQRCKGFFSKSNIRHHAKRCFANDGRKNRTLLLMGRKILGRIHPEASDELRKNVFPVLREDNITRLIRYDRLVILYGNKLCAKYGTLQHQHDMIRSHLRLLGRFLAAMKNINEEVTDFASIYHPKMYDDTVLAIHEIAGFDSKTQTYQAPSTAYTIGCLLKKVAHFYIFDCIKRENTIQKAKTEDFLKLLLEDIGISVNKTVSETQTLQKRRKKVELPSASDIQKLHNYLKNERNTARELLEKEFSYDVWLRLSQSTLTSVQLFNRRRAGEIERVFIEDFEGYQRVNEVEIKRLPKESREIANKYVRFTIRGKLNRTVPVLLPNDLFICIQIILHHRKNAKVSDSNRYVFGIPGKNKSRHNYLRACVLMRKFAKESGVAFPNKLTGTTLRKHIATNCINLNLSENEVADVATFMGHADKVHREHYRQPIVSREILRMSRLLELAQGADDENSEESESEIEDDLISESHNYTGDIKTHKSKNRAQTGQTSLRCGTTQKRSRKRMEVDCESSVSSSGDFGNLQITKMPTKERDGVFKNHKSPKCSKSPYSERTKKRSTSPYGPVGTKKRWSDEEKDIAMTLFEENIRTHTFPSLKQIQEKCCKYPGLSARKPASIKAWISNLMNEK